MKKYTHLSLKEREEIFEMRRNKLTVRLISEKLNRDKSTIAREVKRNKYSDSISYLPDRAHNMARKRKYKYELKINRFPEIKQLLIEMLKMKWSPDVIAAKSFEIIGVKISTESLYQFIYSEEGQKLNLFTLLATGRKKRNIRFARKPRKTSIPERISIDKRPKKANKRKEVGHFEADLTFFKGNQSANIMVITERKTRYSLFIKNNSKKTLEVIKNTFKIFSLIPKKIRKSVTFDNGKEFTKHALIRDFLDMDTYFCDPHSPWQKGQVEKTNAMLHRFIPKKSSISLIDEKTLMNIQNQFNNIPRKVLGYKSPAELFNQQLHRVALQA